MNDPIQIINFKLGSSIYGFFVCNEKHLKTTRNGDLFLDLIFSDSTGIISGKLWEMVNQFQDRFNSGDAVAVKGIITQYNENLQLTVLHINKATHEQYAKYGFSNELLLKKVCEPIDELWKRLLQLMKVLPNPHHQLIKLILKKYEEQIKTIPASIDLHYSMSGGFLKQLVSSIEMAMNIFPHYHKLDKNLTLCGLFVYEIGKVECFNGALNMNYSEAGKMIGHIGLGLNILRKNSALINDFPKELLFRLEHVILINESVGNLDSIHKARFPEAAFIKCIYALDFHMNMVLGGLNGLDS